MKSQVLATLCLTISVSGLLAQDAPKPFTVQKEHEWLKQLNGEWVTQSECLLEPGKPPVQSNGTESVRTIGDLWSLNEMKMEMMGTKFTGIMTIGYDAQKKKFIGTWVCSMCDAMFTYQGSLDSTGKKLTLETEGPDPSTGKIMKMKDVIEIKDKDHKVLSSHMLGEDGKWLTFMTATSKRKK